MSDRIISSEISRRGFLKNGARLGLAASLLANGGCSPERGGTPPSRAAGRPDHPNILFLSLDTTRADHMSCYGYPRVTTPFLDRLAAESIFFTRALSTSSWTLPAHASMFTGKFVTTHGARKNPEGEYSLDNAFGTTDKWRHYSASTIRQDEILLAELLRDAGYATCAVVAGPWLKKVFGLGRGFEHHDDEGIMGVGPIQKRQGPEVTSRAIDWLEARDDRPFFLFLNYFDPHTPYVLPRQLNSTFNDGPAPDLHEHDQKLYDREILYMDWAINRLLEKMKELGLYDNTLIVTVGDHGELFGDKGKIGHGLHLYQGCLHVPFFVKYPLGEMAPAVRDDFVQVTEIMPLLLDRLNLPVPDGVQGSPIEMVSHPIIAEAYPTESESEDGHWQVLVDNGYKLHFNSKGNHELYNLNGDPREAHDLFEEEKGLALEMIAKLATHFDALPRPEGEPTPIVLDEDTVRELEAMGYL